MPRHLHTVPDTPAMRRLNPHLFTEKSADEPTPRQTATIASGRPSHAGALSDTDGAPKRRQRSNAAFLEGKTRKRYDYGAPKGEFLRSSLKPGEGRDWRRESRESTEDANQ